MKVHESLAQYLEQLEAFAEIATSGPRMASTVGRSRRSRTHEALPISIGPVHRHMHRDAAQR